MTLTICVHFSKYFMVLQFLIVMVMFSRTIARRRTGFEHSIGSVAQFRSYPSLPLGRGGTEAVGYNNPPSPSPIGHSVSKRKVWKRTKSSHRPDTIFKTSETTGNCSTKHYYYNQKLKPHQIVARVLTFWSRAGPIIAHYQWTRAWFSLRNGCTREYRDLIYDKLHDRYAPRALDIILDMKGLFIKLGQVLSSRPDFVPHQYTDRFGLLQDYVPPWDGEEIKNIITQSLQQFQGVDFEEIFDTFDERPLGSASIGQVHAATLNPKYYNHIRSNKHQPPYSGGSRVAVKVMHRDAEDRFRYDFKIFKWLCRVALPGWRKFLDELERQMMTEFDYRQEASNLRIARSNMMESPFKNKVVIPEPIEDCSSPYVLVMELLEGEKLAEAAESQLTQILEGNRALARDIIRERRKDIFTGKMDVSHKSLYRTYCQIENRLQKHSMKNRVRTLLRLVALARAQRSHLRLLLDAHGYQIFVHGRFNGDPHPGNVLLLNDGRLGLIDYGQFKVLSEKERIAVSKIIKEIGIDHISNINKGAVKQAMVDVGFRFRYNKDDDVIRRIASLFFDSDGEKSEFGFPSPQEYLLYLQSREPILHIPDSVVFIARCSFLFRGMSALLGEQVRTAHRWATSGFIFGTTEDNGVI